VVILCLLCGLWGGGKCSLLGVLCVCSVGVVVLWVVRCCCLIYFISVHGFVL